jgi:integrase
MMIPFSSKNWTVGGYLDYWLKDVMPYKVRINTMVTYESMVRIYIKPTIGKKKLVELGVRDVTQALDELERKGVPSRTRQKYKQALSSCLSHAMREELVFRNVAMIAKIPIVRASPIIPWTASQARYFLEQARDSRYYVAYLMMITYGMRIGETLGLRWSDVDFNNDIFVIRQQVIGVAGKRLVQTVKTDASRRQLPLISAVRQALIEHATKNKKQLIRFDPNRELTSEDLIITTRVGTPLDADAFRTHNF